MGVYETLGVRRVINADERATWLGGALMPQPVLDAMLEAARAHVDMFELQRAVGLRLAKLTNNEAAYVTTGAAAGLVVSTLACAIGSDLPALARVMEGAAPPRDEVVIQRAHRIPYDPAIRVAGCRLVEVGNVLQTFPWELEAAITAGTAMVLYVAGDHLQRGALSLRETVRIAHAHGVPVVVDAASQLPPPENLWRFTQEEGADLAVFSGGKDLCGPQASGLIVGRTDLIAACSAHGSPHQRLARPMKVGKEEMVGLLAAVELYLQQDHPMRLARSEEIVHRWVEAFDGCPGVTARRDFPNEAGQPVPRALIEFDPSIVGMDAREIRRRLWEGNPPIAVALAGSTVIWLTPDTLHGDDERVISERLAQVLGHTNSGVGRSPTRLRGGLEVGAGGSR